MKKIITITIIIIITYLISALSPYSVNDVDLRAVKMIESANLPFVIGREGEIGLYQITPILLKDYNNYHKIKIPRLALFIPFINSKVAKWYIGKRIPQMIRAKGYKVTVRNILIAYNGGIKYVGRKTIPKITERYLEKYRRLTK